MAVSDDAVQIGCMSTQMRCRRSHMAAPVMTIAGSRVNVCCSSLSTVAGVRAVATVIMAPRCDRSEIICAVRLDTLASFVSNVPSRSVTNRWRQASSGNMSLAILSIYFIAVYVYSYGVSYLSALVIFCLIVHIDLYGDTEQKTRTVGVAFIYPHLPLKQTCYKAAYMQSQSGSL